MEKENKKKKILLYLPIVLIGLIVLYILFNSDFTGLKNKSTKNRPNDVEKQLYENNELNKKTVNKGTVDNKNDVSKEDKVVTAKEEEKQTTDNSSTSDSKVIYPTIDMKSKYGAGKYSGEYSNLTEYEIAKDFCMNNDNTYVYKIENGFLSLINKETGESSIYNDSNNFKKLVYVQLYTSCTSDAIFFLTDDGKLYRTTGPLFEIKNVNDINSIIKFIELPMTITDLGIAKTYDIPSMGAGQEALIKDTNGFEYYGTGNDFCKMND